MAYALDANIIIHLLKNTPTVVAWCDNVFTQEIQIVIPPYVDFEIRRGIKYANAIAKERVYKQLCNSCEMGEMRRETWELAATIYSDLRKASYTVGDADILIAAFCIMDGYTLVTNNTKDFHNINGLQIEDWTK